MVGRRKLSRTPAPAGTRARLGLRARLALWLAAAAAGPLAAGAAVALGADPLVLLGGAVAAAAAIQGGLSELRALSALAEEVETFAAPRGSADVRGDDVDRMRRGVAALQTRLEAATRRADPARLEDPLTGLPNRLAVMRRTRDEISRARRKVTPLSVAVLELDGLSDAAVADALGREGVERALRLTAETLVQSLRAYDLVGRWEGMVFVAVMPEAEIEHAVEAIRRIRDRIAEDDAARVGQRATSASAGVAVLQPDDATLADIVARALTALAKAQSRGGGAVEAAPGPRFRPGRITTV